MHTVEEELHLCPVLATTDHVPRLCRSGGRVRASGVIAHRPRLGSRPLGRWDVGRISSGDADLSHASRSDRRQTAAWHDGGPLARRREDNSSWPAARGLLTGTLGWHAVFAVNVPLALLTALMVLLWVPKDQPGADHFHIARLGHELDVLGLGLFAGFLLSLTIFPMNLSRPIWLALLVAVLFGAACVWHSLGRQQPFIDVWMLVRNHPLTITYLRVIALLMLVYCVFYGLAQWLESAVGLSSATAGLVTLPMSVVAAISSLTGVCTKGLRGPFLFGIGAAVAGGISLLFVTSGTPIWLIAVAFMCFGVPLGTFSTATQAAIYIQAPPEQIGTAAGMQRTASYIGAISSASLLALFYGQRATDLGLHSLAATIGGIGAVLFIATLFDRTIPREA